MADPAAGGEYIQLPETATDGSIEEFQNDALRQTDAEAFSTFMRGEQTHHGGRHDLQSRGLSSDDIPQRTDALLNPYQQPGQPEEELYVQQPQQPQQDFRQLYGQSENEKGELRAQLSDAMNRLTSLEQEKLAASLQLPNFFPGNNPSPAPPVQQAQPNNVRREFDPSLVPRLVDKEDGEPMFAEDVDALLRNKVAPVIYDLQQRLEEANNVAVQSNQRMFEAEKARMGITPAMERTIVAQNPWLQGMRDPSSYLAALGNLKAKVEAQPLQAPPQGVAQPTFTQPQRQAVRQRTFVERGGQAAGPAQADTSSQNPNTLFAQAWAKTMQLPFGEQRAKAQKELLRQRGMRQYTGYRDPQVLTS